MKNDRTGEVLYTPEGEKIVIAKYVSATDVTVRMHDGALRHTSYYALKSGRFHSKRVIKDHKGIEYPTNMEMASHYGVPYATFRLRLKNGWDLKKALETPVKDVSSSIKTDHLGVTYRTQQEMAKAWEIPPHTLSTRLRDGMDIEKALTQPLQNRGEAKDHLGNIYPSFSAMCRAYDSDITTVKKRLNKGWVLRDALETPKAVKETPCMDHLGNGYESISAMCSSYGISRATYKNRMRSGWGIEETLTTPVNAQMSNEESKAEKVGEVKRMANGLDAKIIGYINKDNIKVQFEDGLTKKASYHDFERGRISHPGLKPVVCKKGSVFHGIKMCFVTRAEDDAYYTCECPKCGMKFIATPHDAYEHVKVLG